MFDRKYCAGIVNDCYPHKPESEKKRLAKLLGAYIEARKDFGKPITLTPREREVNSQLTTMMLAHDGRQRLSLG